MELAKDNGKSKPGEVVKSFAVSDNPIHCVVHLKPLDVTTVLTGTLIAVEAEKYRNFTVATTNITGVVGTTSVDFKFGVAKSWPEGSYKFLIKTADGKLQKEISFEIK
jgi:hypothetical protein